MTKTVATPAQMVEAWECGAMHGSSPRYAREEFRAHPPTIPDPIFHRSQNLENGGWHSASGITNPSAIHGMRGWLKNHGLVAPEATEKAWAENLRRVAERDAVARAASEVVMEYDRAAMRSGQKPGAREFAQAVVDAMLTRFVNTIGLTVEITNVYDGKEIKSTQTVRVPPPAAIEHLRLAEWAEEHLFPLTGTGRTKGDAGYFVEVLESPDEPGLVGEQFEWGT